MTEKYVERHNQPVRKPKRVDYEQRKAAYDAFFQTHGRNLAVKDHLQRLSTECLAWNSFWAAHAAFERGDPLNCEELLDFAKSTFPGLSGRSEWSRLTWKKRMGPGVWSMVKVPVRLLRDVASGDFGHRKARHRPLEALS